MLRVFLYSCLFIPPFVLFCGAKTPDLLIKTYFARRHPNGSLVDAKNRLHFELPIKEEVGSAELHVEPNLIPSGEQVSVLWSGVQNANKSDMIALYCPSYDSPDHYLDFINVTVSPNYLKGFGVANVSLVNMRTSCEFRYYQKNKVLVAVSNEVSFKGGSEIPLQGHLALTGDSTQMRVMWVSGTNETPIVHYGWNASLSQVAKGTTKTYNASDMCGPPASTVGFWDPGYIHDVLLMDLKPGQEYFYSYGSLEVQTAVHRFKAAPNTGKDVFTKFIAFGDMGISEPAQNVAELVVEEAKQGSMLVFHNGDISYARGYAYIWDQWHRFVEPFATMVPYMVGIGNHEQDHIEGGEKDPSHAPGNGFHPWWAGPFEFQHDSFGECGVPMYYRFHMPDNGNAVFWYSYDYGNVHFIMMSTEHNITKGSRQYTWLENDLRSVNRQKTPWLIVAGHRPMYTSQEVITDFIVSIGMRHLFEDLLYKYKVDLALWAHYHSYERTCPVYKGKCQDGAPVHIVVGTAGKDLDHENYLKMDWSMFRMNDYGYGRVTAYNHTTLLWQWIRAKDKALLDQVLLEK